MCVWWITNVIWLLFSSVNWFIIMIGPGGLLLQILIRWLSQFQYYGWGCEKWNNWTWMWKIFLKGHILVMSIIVYAFIHDFSNVLVYHFQQHEHSILLDVVAHVKIGFYLFQVILWNIHVMLPKVIFSRVFFFKSLVMQFYF